MSKEVEWSNLHEDLVDCIGNGLFSKFELIRFRSICKNWRSAVATNKPLLKHRSRRFLRSPYGTATCSLSTAAFYRVILSSYPDKGWLIKTQDNARVFSDKQQLLSPLSSLSVDSSNQTLDLLEFTVSEIHQSYGVQYFNNWTTISYNFGRVVVVENLVFVVDDKKKIWCCNTSKGDEPWARIMDEEVTLFSDILLHKGHVYALDLTGATWWISLSELNIFQFGPSTPLAYYEINDCKDRKLVEYCGDLCIVHRFRKKFLVKHDEIERTVGFKVYKMDEELVEWVEVKSLGDKAIVMATGTCFSVLAREYYGCLENAIYFIDEKEQKNAKVFKLGDGSITNMADCSNSSESCFDMLSPPFI